ncbi:hypothetical protein [Streptomyces sp. NPDC008125]|uniref:hypothetical protein n=1 Tax=Streptomyces sp. NPDC008125 TaxID=3364811 RepID=UPI0036E406CF
MTLTQRRRGVAVTANPRRGIRLRRTTALRRTEAGRIALPLSIARDGTEIGDAELVLTVDETAALHAELGRQLADLGVPTTGADHDE